MCKATSDQHNDYCLQWLIGNTTLVRCYSYIRFTETFTIVYKTVYKSENTCDIFYVVEITYWYVSIVCQFLSTTLTTRLPGVLFMLCSLYGCIMCMIM